MRSFKQTRYAVPPGGKWFFELEGDRVEHPIYEFALKRVDEILRRHGRKDSAAVALAEYMCPHMPSWFCNGSGESSPVITQHEARENAMPFFSRNLVPVDVVVRRMEKCMTCPMHRRDFCLTCSAQDDWIRDMFGGRRPRMHCDAASGCCTCVKTYEAVLASVEYKEGEPVWSGAPDTCWRNTR